MKKIIFLLAFLLASFSFLSAQNLVFQNQNLEIKAEKPIAKPHLRAELELGYTDGAGSGTYPGYNIAASTTAYISACISFTAAQMSSYVGGTLHTIEVFVPPLVHPGGTNLMGNLVGYKIWIKNTLDGAIIQEKDVTSSVVLEDFNLFTLTTPYTITNAPLVIGITASFTNSTTATFARYPVMAETQFEPYPTQAYNMMSSTSATAHGAGASFTANNTRAILLWGHVTGNSLPANDLCAVDVVGSNNLKWVGTPATFTAIIQNNGTAPQNNFTVQLIDAANNVIGTPQTNTTALAAGAFKKYVFTFTPTAAANVRAQVVHTGDANAANNISAPSPQKIYPLQPLAYCNYSALGGVGAGANVDHQGAIEYTATDLVPYAGKVLTGVDVVFGVPAATIAAGCKVWVRSSLTGANLVEKVFVPVNGWNSVTFDTPFPIPSTGGIYVGWSAISSQNFIIGMTNNTPIITKGTHIQFSTNAWQTYTQHNAIIGVVSDGSSNVTITTAVNPTGAGDVTGGGTQPSGSTFTLIANANPGYAFQNWTPGNSTANPLTLTNVTANATYTANFISTGPGDCNPPTNLNVVYNGSCNAATLTWTPPVGKSGVVAPKANSLSAMAKQPIDKSNRVKNENHECQRGYVSSGVIANEPVIEFFSEQGRGPASEYYCGYWEVPCMIRKGNLTTFTPTTVGSAGNRNLQAMEYVNGTLYAVDYSTAGNNFGTINMTNGAWTTVASNVPYDAVTLAYNPTNGLTYTFPWGGGPFGTVNLTTGAYSHIGNVSTSMYATIDNDGVCYAIANVSGMKFGTINLATGAFTTIANITNGATGSVQELAIDRETNELIWAAVGGTTSGNLYKINKTTGVPTLYGTVSSGSQIAVFATITSPPLNCDPITNLSVTSTGSTVNLSWTAAPGSPTGYKIEYDGTVLVPTQTGTSYTHTPVPDGLHTYVVTALYSTGCIPFGVTETVIVGDMCIFKIEMQDDYGDGWDGSYIEVKSNGISYGTATVPYDSYGTTAFLVVPSGQLNFIWVNAGGPYDDEVSFQIFNSNNVQIFECLLGDANYYTSNATFFTYSNNCGGSGPSDVSYNVYRGTTKIAGPITATTFTDNTFSASSGHTWSVKAICTPSGESAAATKTMPACSDPQGDCNPPQNLTVEYALECGKATLEWEAPAGKIGSRYDGVLTWFNEQVGIQGGVGWDATAGNDMTAAVRYIPSELAALGFSGAESIISISLGVYQNIAQVNTMEIKIWEGGTSVTDPGTLIYSQPITNLSAFSNGNFTEVMLNNPVPVDPTKELRIGWRLVNTAGYPFARDEYGYNSTFGRHLIYCADSPVSGWKDVYAYWGWNWNWAIKALVIEGGTQYNVYRNGNLIKENTYSKKFIDDNFNPDKAHEWAVAAVCETGGESGRISQSMPACNATPPGPCNPAQNLAVTYATDCLTANLTWDDPAGKKSSPVVAPIVEGTDTETWKRPSASSGFTSLSGKTPTPSSYDPKSPNDWITYSGEVWDGIGNGSPNEFVVAARFTAADLTALKVTNGDVIKKMRIAPFQLYNIASITLHVYQGGTSPTNPGTLLYQQPVPVSSLNDGVINEINLTTDFVINSTQELWIGYKIVCYGGWPAGADEGPRTPGKSDLMYWEGVWQDLWEASGYSLSCNWIIEAFVSTPLTTVPAAPTQLTTTPVGTSLLCNLSWTNPTTTIGGATLSSITKVVIERNGAVVHEITTGTAVGAPMTWTDNTITASGRYTYRVYAENAAGAGYKAVGNPVDVGVFCDIKMVFGADWSDSWCYGAGIKVRSNGVNYGGLDGCYSNNVMKSMSVPAAPLEFILTGGYAPYEGGWFKIYNADDDLIYDAPVGSLYGLEGPTPFFTYTNTCIPGLQYLVYRDGVHLATTKNNAYDDKTYNSSIPHTWAVRVLCDNNTLSTPISVTKPACGDQGTCNPPTNLIVDYADDCGYAELTWTEPGKKSGSKPVIDNGSTQNNGSFVMSPSRDKTEGAISTGTERKMPDALKQQMTLNTTNDFTGFRGPNSDLYYTTEGAPVSVRKTTVSGPFPGTTLGTHNREIQAMGYANGVLYGVDVNSSYTNNAFGTINMTTGAFTNINANFPCDAVSICFNPVDGLIYTCPWTEPGYGGNLGTVNPATGIFTPIAPLTGANINTYYMAIDNNGVAYAFRNTTNQFGTVNLTNGTFTQIATIPFTVNYCQNLTIDRETNELYWLSKSADNPMNPSYYKVNKATGALTHLAGPFGFYASTCAIKTEAGELCDPVTNLQYNVSGNTVGLTWTAAPGSPTGYEVRRNGTLLQTVTTTSFTDNSVPDGQYSYSLTALFAGSDCYPQTVSTPQFVVGSLCPITIELWGMWNDSWYNSTGTAGVEVFVDGVSHGTFMGTGLTGAYGNYSVTYTPLLPGGDIVVKWITGGWSNEKWIKIFDVDGEQVGGCNTVGCVDSWPAGYVVADFDQCGGSVKYNVYRDGALIATKVKVPYYKDVTYNPEDGHIWMVKAICDNGLSTPATKEEPSCWFSYNCAPIKNLTVEQWEDCRNILKWDKPAGKSAITFADPLKQSYIPTPIDIEKDAQKAEQESLILANSENRKATSPIISEPFETSKIEIPKAPKGMVNVTLAANDVWGDGTGYQLLLDQTATQYGITIPTTGFMYTNCSPPANLYDVFSHRIPTGAAPSCTSPVVVTGSQTIQIPAGTYDWCITNPDPGFPRIWIAAAGGGPETSGRRDNYVFEDGYNYLFTMQYWAPPIDNDGVVITTEAAGDPCPAVTNVVATLVPGTQNVNITWNAPTPAPTNYQVLRGTTLLGTVTGTSYTNTNAPVGTHIYTVKAIYPPSNDCVPVAVNSNPVNVSEVLGGGCEAIIVGGGTGSGYEIPLNTFYRYSYTQQIYDAADLAGMVGKEINSVSFEYIHATPSPKNPVTVYLGITTKSTFASTSDWVPVTNLTQVFTGPLNFNNTSQWYTIHFPQPFKYTGGNLVVAVLNNEGNYTSPPGSNPTFRHHTAASKTLHYRVDGTTPINPATVPTATGILSNRNNIRFVACSPFGYNVYRNGLPLGTVDMETYTDFTADYTVPNEYCITVACEAGGESKPVCITAPICKPEPCAPPEELTAVYGLDCAYAKLTWKSPILPKSAGKSGSSGYTFPEIEAEISTAPQLTEEQKLAMENAPVDNTVYLRRAPEGAQQSSTPLPDFFPSRGSTDPIYYGDSNGAVAKGTVGTPFPPVTVGSNGSFQQAYEYINGELYAARWGSGNQLGKINMNTGAWTNIGSIAQCDASALCYNPVNGLTYAFPFTGTGTEGTNWGTINLNTGALTVLGNMTSTYFVAINNEGVAYATVMGTNQFGTINLTTGAFTQTATAPFTPVYVQNMSFDRSTGLLYWMGQDGTNALYYEINVTTTPVTFTLKGTHSTHWMAFTTITEAGTPCPAVTNVTAAVVPGTANVKVNWNTVAGATSQEVTRDGAVIATLGATANTYTDAAASPGPHTYCVKAIFPPASACNPVSVCAPAVTVPEIFPGGCEGVVVGTATTAGYEIPVNTFWNYSYTQQIYDEAEIISMKGKEITSIAFEYVWTAPNTKNPITVYLGTTTKSTFAGTAATNWVPVSELTQVYSKATVFNNENKWFTLQLEQPFTYEGGNLVVAVLNNHGTYTSSSNPTFRHHVATGNKTMHYRKDTPATPIDPAALPAASGVMSNRSNIRFVVCEDEKEYNIYRDGVLIAANHKGNEYIDDIAGGFDPTVGHCWEVKYIRAGEHNLECPDGVEVCLDQCAPKPPCETFVVGTPTATTAQYTLPVNTYWAYSYTQQIFDAAEIGDPGIIASISFQYVHTTPYPTDIKVYMGMTTQSTFAAAANFIPLTAGLELVFEGNPFTFATSAELWNQIPLQNQFNYTGGNLVVAVLNAKGNNIGSDPSFRTHATTGNKSVCFYHDSGGPINPANPMSAILNAVYAYRNNIKFEICGTPEDVVDMAATKIHLCPAMVKTQTLYDIEVTVKNNSGYDATNYIVEVREYPNLDNILGTATNVPTLAPGASAIVPVPVIFNKLGEYDIRGRVEIADDVNPLNNQTGNLKVTVRPKDDDEIVEVPCPANVGAGLNTIPFNFYYTQSVVQSLYTQAELGIEGGYIKDITWFYDNSATEQNRPVKVWMRTTELNSLAAGWLPYDSFTKVYEGMIKVPAGKSEVKLTLTTPYLYMGGNLVIMTDRDFNAPWINGVLALTTTVTPAQRTRAAYGDSQFNPATPTSASNNVTLNVISNIRLTVNVPAHGKIKGTASCEGLPIEGVKVAINEMPGAIRITDNAGNYYFGFVPLGTYNMTATKFMYFDGYAGPIKVEKDKTEIVNFENTCLLPNYTVWGAVANAEGILLEGAKVELKGYENYETTTAYNGSFDFLDVYAPKEYTLTITLKGYQPYTATVNVVGHTNLGTIVLLEIPFPPTNVVAVEVDPFVEITWEAPVPPPPTKVFRYDNGVRTAHLGFSGTTHNRAVLGAVHREATTLTSMSWYLSSESGGGAPHATVNLFVFDLNASGMPTSTILFSKMNEPNEDEKWNTLEFATPVACPNGFMLAVGGNAGVFIGLGTDSGTDPNWPFISNTHYFSGDYTGGSFSTWESVPFYVNGMIRAEGENGKKFGAPVVTGETQPQDMSPILVKADVPVYTGDPYPQTKGGDTRSITGFKLWRLQPGQEATPNVWTTLTNLPVPATQYTDVTWPTAAMGDYKWAVRTCYHGGVESDPAFSNTLYKNVEVIYTIDIATNSGDSPAGAWVELTNAGKSYTSFSTSTGITFPAVLCGTYNLKITFAGFQTYTASVNITQTGSHQALLIEIINDPKDAIATPDECNVLFKWSHEAEKSFLGFTVYLNDVIVKTGVQVKEYLFTNLATGDYKAGVVANYGSGNSNVAEANFSVNCLNIHEIEEGNYEIYPNPTMDRIYIRRASDTPALIEVYDAMGKFIHRVETTDVKYELNVVSYANGTYFIRVTEGTNTGVKSFVKQ